MVTGYLREEVGKSLSPVHILSRKISSYDIFGWPVLGRLPSPWEILLT